MSFFDFWNVYEFRIIVGKKIIGECKFGNILNKYKIESWILVCELIFGEGMGEGVGGKFVSGVR